MIVSFLSQLFDSTYLRAWKSKVRDWIRSHLKLRTRIRVVVDWIRWDW